MLLADYKNYKYAIQLKPLFYLLDIEICKSKLLLLLMFDKINCKYEVYLTFRKWTGEHMCVKSIPFESSIG